MAFRQHNGKHAYFYQTNKISYPPRPRLVDLSLYGRIFLNKVLYNCFNCLSQSKTKSI